MPLAEVKVVWLARVLRCSLGGLRMGGGLADTPTFSLFLVLCLYFLLDFFPVDFNLQVNTLRFLQLQ